MAAGDVDALIVAAGPDSDDGDDDRVNALAIPDRPTPALRTGVGSPKRISNKACQILLELIET
jgi:hypothetical protein